jgi:hypothetical protein
MSNRVADAMQMQRTTVCYRDPFMSLIPTTLDRLTRELKVQDCR